MPRILISTVGRLAVRLVSDTRGQDLIEYALMAGTIVVVVAGFLPPQLMPAISGIFSRVVEVAAAVR
jgi:Flp pilus assembly pilin Flp